jgi:ketosteroid isomerase-like protein
MSQENVQTVRRLYEVAYAQRSVENVRDAVDESFVWHQRPEWPGRSQYRADDMPQLWAELDDTYAEFSLVPEDFAPVGEYVVVTARTSARMRASEARIDSTLFHVWHLRGGRAREAWTYGTRAEALDAVGLSE